MRLNRSNLWTWGGWAAALALACAAGSRPAGAAPTELIPVGDPLEAEMRLLDLSAPADSASGRWLPHLHMRPLGRYELTGVWPARPSGVARIAQRRIARALEREWLWPDAPGSTPRLIRWSDAEGSLAEMSLSVEGAHEVGFEDGHSRDRWDDGSGLHARFGLAADRWLLFSNIWAGQLARARRIGDPLINDQDVTLETEDTYAVYVPASRRWSAQFGRSRWHWGPGREASLLLSRTAPAMTGLSFRMRIEPLRADAQVLNATLSTSEERQLAAHRVEWQPTSALRLGVAEAAIYRGTSWRPIYLLGLVPYPLAQRLEAEESLTSDTTGRERNNEMLSFDAAWRVADGTRLYGEWLIDDLHARDASFPNKWGVQLGLDGVGEVRGTRVGWNVEWTRVSRWVYSSFFGAEAAIRGEPIGFPLGPDVDRLAVRVTWDPSVDWQCSLEGTHTRKGENDLAEPFVPGSPVPDGSTLEGVASSERRLDAGVRWWPASAVDVSVSGGWYREDDAAHVRGAGREGARVRVAVTLGR